MPTMQQLIDTLPQRGTVEWIGIRPARNAAVESVEHSELGTDTGIAGDHFSKAGGARQVTLIQAEHLDAVASMLGIDSVNPAAVRRNFVIRGVNLLALKDRRFSLGAAMLEYTGLCHPCSRMEAALGPGGYNALRGHGGITARVLEGGSVRVGDRLAL